MNEYFKTWLQEEIQPFAGWDFSYLTNRMFEDQPPWSYPERAAELMRSATLLIDTDTGGGERLLELQPHWPQRVVVTEAYPPNVEVAHSRLSPWGAKVVMANMSEIAPMPFASGTFDLFLNRHGSFNAAEIARVLAPGGTFLTKQVHGLWAQDLLAVFGAFPQWPQATPERYVPMLKNAGLTLVTVDDFKGRLCFTDVGAIVYYLKAIPWLVPGFSVTSHQDALFALQKRIDSGDELAFESRTYLIEARRD